MSLTTYLSYNVAPKQRIVFSKNSGTTVGFIPYSINQFTGTPGAVVNPVTQAVAGAGSTAPGLLVTPANKTGSYTLINNGAQKYITQVAYFNTVASNLQVYDKIVEYAISPLVLGTVNCTNIDMGTRMYNNYPTMMFVEIGTGISATATTIVVNYTNGDAVAGRSSTSVNISGFAVGRWVAIPLQTGDNSVLSIQSVVIGGAVASAGSFNVIIVRPIITVLPVFTANRGDVFGIDKLSNVPIHDNTYLQPIINSDGATSGSIRMDIEITSA